MKEGKELYKKADLPEGGASALTQILGMED